MKPRQPAVRKAAILIASLDDQTADHLLAQMTSEQAATVRQAVTMLGDVDRRERQAVIEEFLRIGPLLPAKAPPGIELEGRHTRQWTPPAPPAPKSESPLGSRRFQFLDEATSESLARYLEREHPQTIAVVVSQLTSQRAAAVLAELPADVQGEVTMRLVHLHDTDPEVVHEIERGMQTWISEQARALRQRMAGLETLKGILAAADGPARQNILRHLAERDKRLAGKLAAQRRTMTFADLNEYDDIALANVLQQAPGEIVLLALVGASNDFIRRSLGLLAPEDALRLRTRLNNPGPIRLSDVDQAQQELARLATRLEEAGERRNDDAKRLSVAV